jgi:hypothetical protein
MLDDAAAVSASGAGRGAADHPAPHRAAVGRVALWYGIFGAPFCWSAQLIVTYALAAHACFPQRQPLIRASSSAAWIAACAVIVVALIGAVAALVISLANWRATQTEKSGEDAALLEAGEGRTRFMAYSGILLSALFIGGVILSGLALLLVRVC